jgi:hypothetical protein
MFRCAVFATGKNLRAVYIGEEIAAIPLAAELMTCLRP